MDVSFTEGFGVHGGLDDAASHGRGPDGSGVAVNRTRNFGGGNREGRGIGPGPASGHGAESCA